LRIATAKAPQCGGHMEKRYLRLQASKSTTFSRRALGLGTAAVLSAALTRPLLAAAQAPADLILENGAIYTVDAKKSWAEAVAVRDGKIVYAGTNTGAASFKGADTRRVDLKGRLVLPGFIDPHNHVYLHAENMFWVTLPRESTLEAYGAAIRSYRAENPGLKQVRGVGWDMRFIIATAEASGKQPRQLLDELVGDVPAVIITHGHHQIWVNTKALQNAGLTKDTKDPQGGLIDRDKTTGEPSGILREFGAQNLVISKLPDPDFTVEQFSQAVLSWQTDFAPRNHLTGALVPTHYPSPNFFVAMQKLSDEGKLTARYSVAQWADENRGTEQIPELVATRARFKGGPNFHLNSIKIFATGVTDSGLGMIWPQESLNRTMAALDKERFRIFVHDIGPLETYERVLDAYEYTFKQNGRRDARHMITHVGLGSQQTVGAAAPRFKSLGIRADGHPTPTAFYEKGVNTTVSSDYPSFLNTHGNYSAIPRIALSVKNGVPLEDMIASVTMRAAEAIFAEKEAGSIEVGKSADLVVLDRNLFRISVDEMNDAKTMLLMFAGKELFRDPSF
jgi:predicted amidohydrolase YtcJ